LGARRADAAQLRAQQFWAGKGEYAHVPVRDIAAAWRCSSSGLASAAALAAPLPPSRDGDAALAWAPYALQGARLAPRPLCTSLDLAVTRPAAGAGWRAFKACLQREWVLTERYSFLYYFRVAQARPRAVPRAPVRVSLRARRCARPWADAPQPAWELHNSAACTCAAARASADTHEIPAVLAHGA